jgi:hypothetical protein
VDYGDSRFGFVHRSFQEYFAACWMADELEDEDFHQRVWSNALGWNETLYLAVARLKPDRRRRGFLIDLLEKGWAEFALNCVQTAGTEEPWLAGLVRYLSKYYHPYRRKEVLSAAECAELCLARPDAIRALRGMFEKDNREGPALAAAVELAEAFAGCGVEECRKLLDAFFKESAGCGLDRTDRMAPADGFYVDLYPVTNREYECMVRRHARPWDDSDNHPVDVLWSEAQLFCRWRGAEFRLPSEEEWYKAAAWDPVNGVYRKYPWGDEFDAGKCNTRKSGINRTTPVDKFPEGRSYYGFYDMSGNVSEWVSYHRSGLEWGARRGGSWGEDQRSAQCAFEPLANLYYNGFRCVRTLR